MRDKSQISLQKISWLREDLPSVIESSMGFPTPAKISQVLQTYALPPHYLIGAFMQETLIGIVGFKALAKEVIVKHFSIFGPFRQQGIGKALINKVIKDFSPVKMQAETDHEAVGFYKRLGFSCTTFDGKYGIRYHCIINQPPP